MKKNKKTVDYFEQQNCLPAFKKEWVEFAHLHSQALQSTVKRVDLAYNSFFKEATWAVETSKIST